MIPIVSLVEPSDLFHPAPLSVKECLHGRSAAAHFSLMRSFRVVAVHPSVQVGLQLIQRVIQLARKAA